MKCPELNKKAQKQDQRQKADSRNRARDNENRVNKHECLKKIE